jgi:hypothetical protein
MSDTRTRIEQREHGFNHRSQNTLLQYYVITLQ